MAQPNLSQIQEIAELEKILADLAIQISRAQAELEATKQKCQRDEESERNKLLEQGKQQLFLEKVRLEIEKLREEEDALRARIVHIAEQAVDEFFNQGNFAKFIFEIISKNRQTPLKILATQATAKYLPLGTNYDLSETSDVLRIFLGTKSYILDPEPTKVLLREKLIKAYLPSSIASLEK